MLEVYRLDPEKFWYFVLFAADYAEEDYIAKNIDTPEEIFIIGGGSIYAQFLPYAKHLYLTEVDDSPEADVFFPEFDRRNYRRKTIKHGNQGELKYTFVKYTKK